MRPRVVAYRVESSSNSLLSAIDGNDYASYNAAIEACLRVGGNELATHEIDSDNGLTWLVYRSEAERDLDRDGAANNAIARIEAVREEDV